MTRSILLASASSSVVRPRQPSALSSVDGADGAKTFAGFPRAHVPAPRRVRVDE